MSNTLEHLVTYNPRRVRFWECCEYVFLDRLANHNSFLRLLVNEDHLTSTIRSPKNIMLTLADSLYQNLNKNHSPSFEVINNIIKIENQEHLSNNLILNEYTFNTKENYNNIIKIAFANMSIDLEEIDDNIKGSPRRENKKYEIYKDILKVSRKNEANIVLLPENSIPLNYLSKLAKYSEKNSIGIIGGLEHLTIQGITYNFVVTILPFKNDTINDAVIIFRLKNYYSHSEKLVIEGYGNKVPQNETFQYDLINWRNLYFTTFYCFEIADSLHRSLFKSKIDLMIVSEWNKDTNYFSNIVESTSRDLHCYIAQVNTSQFGDSRLTQPSDTATKDILKLKGGNNTSVLVGEINLEELRQFQLKSFARSNSDTIKKFKPLPPGWEREYVWKRINNQSVI